MLKLRYEGGSAIISAQGSEGEEDIDIITISENSEINPYKMWCKNKIGELVLVADIGPYGHTKIIPLMGTLSLDLGNGTKFK